MNNIKEYKKIVKLNDFIPDAIYEIRYYSNYNFVGKRIKGYDDNCALLTYEAAKSLKKINDELLLKGYKLKIFDAYRPQISVDYFIEWSKDIKDTKMKNIFYPNIDKSMLFEQGYIAKKSSHSRGSTVDLTLVDIKSGKELDMGSSFDYFDKISHFDYKNLTEKQLKNRQILHDIMTNNGFISLNEEWWHFTLKNEPFPDTYFSFPINSKYFK